MEHTEKKQVINRLKRAEGQLRGIQQMIDQDQECVNVITQLSAVRSSIDRLMGLILAENLKSCLEHPHHNHTIQQENLEKAIQLIVKK